MMDGVELLIAHEEFWSSVGYWILVAGLVGDITVLVVPKHRERLEKVLTAFFTIVIIIGVAIEHRADATISILVSREQTVAAQKMAQLKKEAADTNNKAESFRLQIADATERAATAQQAGAEANRIAEEEHLARVKLEQKMADRHISGSQRERMLQVLSSRHGKVEVEALISEGREASAYAWEIDGVFHQAKWEVEDPRAMMSFARPLAGILLDARTDDESSKNLAKFLAQAFAAAGIATSRYMESNVNPGTVLVLVGSK